MLFPSSSRLDASSMAAIGVGEKSMESAEEKPTGITIQEILPPRLEDAGLEDCALPLESIQEAFIKAAAAACFRETSPSTSDDEAEPEILVDSRDRADCTSPDILRASKSDEACAVENSSSDDNAATVKKKKDASENKEAFMEGLQKLEIR